MLVYNQTPTHIKHIVLAEDDADDQNIFQLAMEEINPGIKVTFVSDGNELLQLLESYHPDLIFLDLDMPYKNGLQCLMEIRGNTQTENMPVVVFSSTTRPANIQTAYHMGAHLFFIKPPVYSEYLSSIRNILKLDWVNPVQVREQYCSDGQYSSFN